MRHMKVLSILLTLTVFVFTGMMNFCGDDEVLEPLRYPTPPTPPTPPTASEDLTGELYTGEDEYKLVRVDDNHHKLLRNPDAVNMGRVFVQGTQLTSLYTTFNPHGDIEIDTVNKKAYISITDEIGLPLGAFIDGMGSLEFHAIELEFDIQSEDGMGTKLGQLDCQLYLYMDISGLPLRIEFDMVDSVLQDPGQLSIGELIYANFHMYELVLEIGMEPIPVDILLNIYDMFGNDVDFNLAVDGEINILQLMSGSGLDMNIQTWGNIAISGASILGLLDDLAPLLGGMLGDGESDDLLGDLLGEGSPLLILLDNLKALNFKAQVASTEEHLDLDLTMSNGLNLTLNSPGSQITLEVEDATERSIFAEITLNQLGMQGDNFNLDLGLLAYGGLQMPINPIGYFDIDLASEAAPLNLSVSGDSLETLTIAQTGDCDPIILGLNNLKGIIKANLDLNTLNITLPNTFEVDVYAFADGAITFEGADFAGLFEMVGQLLDFEMPVDLSILDLDLAADNFALSLTGSAGNPIVLDFVTDAYPTLELGIDLCSNPLLTIQAGLEGGLQLGDFSDLTGSLAFNTLALSLNGTLHKTQIGGLLAEDCLGGLIDGLGDMLGDKSTKSSDPLTELMDDISDIANQTKADEGGLIPAELMTILENVAIEASLGDITEPLSIGVNGTLDALEIGLPHGNHSELVIYDEAMGDGLDINLFAGLDMNDIALTYGTELAIDTIDLDILLDGTGPVEDGHGQDVILDGAAFGDLLGGLIGEDAGIPTDLIAALGVVLEINEIGLDLLLDDTTAGLFGLNFIADDYSALHIALNDEELLAGYFMLTNGLSLDIANLDFNNLDINTLGLTINDFTLSLYGELLPITLQTIWDIASPLLGDSLPIPEELINLLLPLQIDAYFGKDELGNVLPIDLILSGTIDELNIVVPDGPEAALNITEDAANQGDAFDLTLAPLKLELNGIDITYAGSLTLNELNLLLDLEGSMNIEGEFIDMLMDMLIDESTELPIPAEILDLLVSFGITGDLNHLRIDVSSDETFSNVVLDFSSTDEYSVLGLSLLGNPLVDINMKLVGALSLGVADLENLDLSFTDVGINLFGIVYDTTLGDFLPVLTSLLGEEMNTDALLGYLDDTVISGSLAGDPGAGGTPFELLVNGDLDNIVISIPAGSQFLMQVLDSDPTGLELNLDPLTLSFNGVEIAIADPVSINELDISAHLEGVLNIEPAFLTEVLNLIGEDAIPAELSGLLGNLGLGANLPPLDINITSSAATVIDLNLLFSDFATISLIYNELEALSGGLKIVGGLSLDLNNISDIATAITLNSLALMLYGSINELSVGLILDIALPLMGDLELPQALIDLIEPVVIQGALGAVDNAIIIGLGGTFDALELSVGSDDSVDGDSAVDLSLTVDDVNDTDNGLTDGFYLSLNPVDLTLQPLTLTISDNLSIPDLDLNLELGGSAYVGGTVLQDILSSLSSEEEGAGATLDLSMYDISVDIPLTAIAIQSEMVDVAGTMVTKLNVGLELPMGSPGNVLNLSIDDNSGPSIETRFDLNLYAAGHAAVTLGDTTEISFPNDGTDTFGLTVGLNGLIDTLNIGDVLGIITPLLGDSLPIDIPTELVETFDLSANIPMSTIVLSDSTPAGDPPIVLSLNLPESGEMSMNITDSETFEDYLSMALAISGGASLVLSPELNIGFDPGVNLLLYGELNEFPIGLVLDIIVPMLGDTLPEGMDLEPLTALFDPVTIEGVIAEADKALVVKIAGPNMEEIAIELFRSDDPHFTDPATAATLPIVLNFILRDANDMDDGLRVDFNSEDADLTDIGNGGVALNISPLDLDLGSDTPFSNIALNLTVAGALGLDAGVLNGLLGSLLEGMTLDLSKLKIEFILKETVIDVQAPDIENFQITMEAVGGYSELDLYLKPVDTWITALDINAKIEGVANITTTPEFAFDLAPLPASGDTGFALTIWGVIPGLNLGAILDMVMPLLGDTTELPIPEELFTALEPIEIIGSIGNIAQPFKLEILGNLDNLQILIANDCVIRMGTTDSNGDDDGFEVTLDEDYTGLSFIEDGTPAADLSIQTVDIGGGETETQFSINDLHIELVAKGTIGIGGSFIALLLDSIACDEDCQACKDACAGDPVCETSCGLIPLDLSVFDIILEANNLTVGVDATQAADVITLGVNLSSPTGPSSISIDLNSLPFAGIFAMIDGPLEATLSLTNPDYEMTFGIPAPEEVRLTLYGNIADSMNPASLDFFIDLLLPLLGEDLPIPQEVFDLLSPLTLYGNLATSASPLVLAVDGNLDNLGLNIPGSPEIALTINDSDMTDGLNVVLNPLSLIINGIDITIGEEMAFNSLGLQIGLQGSLFIAGSVIDMVIEALMGEGEELGIPIDLGMFNIGASIQPTEIIIQASSLTAIDILISSPSSIYSEIYLQVDDGSGAVDLATLFGKINGGINLQLPSCDAACEACKTACAGDTACEDACETEMAFGFTGLTLTLYGALNEISFEYIFGLIMPLLGGEEELPIPQELLDLLFPLKLRGKTEDSGNYYFTTQMDPISIIVEGTIDALSIQIPPKPAIELVVEDDNMGDGFDLNMSDLSIELNGVDLTIADPLTFNMLNINIILQGSIGVDGAMVESIIAMLGEEGEESPIPIDLTPFALSFVLNNLTLALSTTDLTTISLFVSSPPTDWSVLGLDLNSVTIASLSMQVNGEVLLALPSCDAACEACKTACAGDPDCESACESEMAFNLNNLFISMFGSLTSLGIQDVLDLLLPLLAGECEEGDTECEDCITACAGDADCELDCTLPIPSDLLDLFAPLTLSGNLASSLTPLKISVDGTLDNLNLQIPGFPVAEIFINDTNGMDDDIFVSMSPLKLTFNMIDIALNSAAEEAFQINTVNLQLQISGDFWVDGTVLVTVLDALTCDEDCEACKAACGGDPDCELACGLLPVDLSPFRIDATLDKLTLDLSNTTGLDGFNVMITSPGTLNMGYSSLYLRYNGSIMAEINVKMLGAIELDLVGCDAACEACKIACAGDTACESACETGMSVSIPGLTVMMYGSLNAFSLDTIVGILLPLLAGECDEDCQTCQAACGGDPVCEQDCALPIPTAILDMLTPLSISGTLASSLAPILIIVSGGLDNISIQMPAGPQMVLNIIDSNGMSDGLEVSLSIEFMLNGIDISFGEELVISALSLTVTLASGTLGVQGTVVGTLLTALSDGEESLLPPDLLEPFELIVTMDEIVLDIVSTGLEDISIFVFTQGMIWNGYSNITVNTDFDGNGSYDDAMASLFINVMGMINLGLGDTTTFGAEDLTLFLHGSINDTSLSDIIDILLPLLASDCEEGDTECETCVTNCAGDEDCELECKLPIPLDVIDLFAPLTLAGNLASTLQPLTIIVDGTMDALNLAIPGDMTGPKLVANMSGVSPDGYYDINLTAFELIFAGIEVELNAGEFIIHDLNIGLELNGDLMIKGSIITVVVNMLMEEPLDIPLDLAILKIDAGTDNFLVTLSTTDLETIFVDVDTQSTWSSMEISVDPQLIGAWSSLVAIYMQAYASIILNIADEFAIAINNFEIWAYGSVGPFPISAVLEILGGFLNECDEDCQTCQAACGGDPVCEADCLPFNINGLTPYFEGITIAGNLAGVSNPLKVFISGNLDRLGINVTGPYDANLTIDEDPTGNAPESDFDILGFQANMTLEKLNLELVLGCDTMCENCKAACGGDPDCEEACEFPVNINKIDIPIGMQGQVIMIGSLLNQVIGLFGDSFELPLDLATFGIYMTLPATQLNILATGMDYISLTIVDSGTYGPLDIRYDDDYAGATGDHFNGVYMAETDFKVYGAAALDLSDTANINFMFNNFNLALYGYMHPTKLTFMMGLLGAAIELPPEFEGLFNILEMEGYLGNSGTPVTISIDGSFTDIIYIGINTLGVHPILDIDLNTPPNPLVEASALLQGYVKIDSTSGETEIVFDNLMLSMVGSITIIQNQLAAADIGGILLGLIGESLGGSGLDGLIGALRINGLVNHMSASGTINDNNLYSSPMQILLNGPIDTMFISIFNTDVNLSLYLYNASGDGGRVYVIGNTIDGGEASPCSTSPPEGGCIQLNEGALWENPVTEVDIWITTIKVYLYYIQIDTFGLRTVGASSPNEGLVVDLFQTMSPTTLIIDSESETSLRTADPETTDPADKVFHDLQFQISNGNNGNPRLNVYLGTNDVSAKAAISLTLNDRVGVYGENISLTGCTEGGLDTGERPHGFLTAYSASYPDQTPGYPYGLYLGLELGLSLSLGIDVEITIINIDFDLPLMKQGDFSALVAPEP